MFNRREFLKTTGLGLVSTAVSNLFLSEAQKLHAGRPNILLILVDDMG
ncbi:MAG: twin-arginine translocation signal domain-containing protein [Candidatus Latescibacterota bacterium]